MKVGDIVTFMNEESTYARWFFGKMGEVISIRKGHCSVRWLVPCRYHDKWTHASSLKMSDFERADI